MPNGHGSFEVKDESLGVATTEQFLTEQELAETQRVLRCLNSLKLMHTSDIRLYDRNGEQLGTVTFGEAEQGMGYRFSYYMKEEIGE